MARKFCSKCETLHDGRCSAAALAKAGKGSGKADAQPATPKPKTEPLTKALDLPAKTEIDWKAKYEALIEKQRKETLERVRRHRARKSKGAPKCT